MNAAIVPFIFDDFQIRTTTDEHGEALFCGKDVALALGYADPTSAIKQHCKGVVIYHPLQTPGGMQEVRFISEPDMLRLIVSSKLESAQRFEQWVFEEVLPSIRKTGSYGQAATPEFFNPANAALFQLIVSHDKTERKLRSHEKELIAVGRRVLALEGTRKEFVSIMGWCNLNDREVSRELAVSMGRDASRRCRQLAVEPGKVQHPAFGEVNTYPVGLLDELFG